MCSMRARALLAQGAERTRLGRRIQLKPRRPTSTLDLRPVRRMLLVQHIDDLDDIMHALLQVGAWDGAQALQDGRALLPPPLFPALTARPSLLLPPPPARSAAPARSHASVSARSSRPP